MWGQKGRKYKCGEMVREPGVGGYRDYIGVGVLGDQ